MIDDEITIGFNIKLNTWTDTVISSLLEQGCQEAKNVIQQLLEKTQ
jgi:hypothetical protein